MDSAAHADSQAPPARGGYHRAQGSSANGLLSFVFDDDGDRQVGSGEVWRCLAVSGAVGAVWHGDDERAPKIRK